MELLLSLPILKDVPIPNFYADITDKYAKIHQIKYFMYCKGLILNEMDYIHFENTDLLSINRINLQLGYSSNLDYSQIYKNDLDLQIYGQACEFISIIINHLWWQIRTFPPC